LEEEQKQDKTCMSCGNTGWKPSTRREFIHEAVVAGVGLAVGATMLGTPIVSAADPEPLGKCEDQLDDCEYECIDAYPLPGNPDNYDKLIDCVTGCWYKYQDCKQQEWRDEWERIKQAIIDYLLAHPWLIVLGAIIIIGGIAIVIVGIGAGLIPIIAFV
jgi:hypothetical protein